VLPGQTESLGNRQCDLDQRLKAVERIVLSQVNILPEMASPGEWFEV
jgi:hypothetical protein